MWNWILVKLGLRTDWMDPRNAPPFVPDVPHEYQQISTVPYIEGLPELPCCKRCGGGSLHPIHHGEQTYVPRVGLSPESVRAIDSTVPAADDPFLTRAANRQAEHR